MNWDLLLFLLEASLIGYVLYRYWLVLKQDFIRDEMRYPVRTRVLNKTTVPRLSEQLGFDIQGLADVPKHQLKGHGIVNFNLLETCTVPQDHPHFEQALAKVQELYEQGCACGHTAMEYVKKNIALGTQAAVCFALVYYPDHSHEVKTFLLV